MLLILAVIFGTFAQANTNALFSSDGKEVRIILQGASGDMDAPQLFHAINAAPTDNSDYELTSLSFPDEAGLTFFDLACKLSKRIDNFGSCTLTLRQNAFTTVNPHARAASVKITDRESAAAMASHFHQSTPTIFRSRDGLLTISYSAETGLFSVAYQSR